MNISAQDVNRKYELVKYMTKQVDDTTLYRIRALQSFGDVKKGDLGGWIKEERNLRFGFTDKNAWIYDNAAVIGGAVIENAKVFNNAIIYSETAPGVISGNAKIYGDATVTISNGAGISGNAKIYGAATVEKSNISGDAQVFGNAEVYGGGLAGNAKVYGNAKIKSSSITGDAEIFGNAVLDGCGIYGKAQIYGDSRISGQDINIFGCAKVQDKAVIEGKATIFDNARIYDNAKVRNNSQIFGNAEIYGDANVSGDSEISGYTRISGNAAITSISDYFVVEHIGPENEILIAFKQEDKSIMVSHLDFNGVMEAFEYIIKERHKDDKYLDIYLNQISTIKKQLESTIVYVDSE